MDGCKIEELYYLYRQGCPIARTCLIEYCYWQIKTMLPGYCIKAYNHHNYYNDYYQIIVLRCLKALDAYRPDRGMGVRSYLSMIIHNSICTLIVRGGAKIVKEPHVAYSLDDYCDGDEQLRMIDNVSDNYCVDAQVKIDEQLKLFDEFVAQKCTDLEKEVIAYHRMGLTVPDIAIKINRDVRAVYNTNYRILRKIGNSNLFD